MAKGASRRVGREGGTRRTGAGSSCNDGGAARIPRFYVMVGVPGSGKTTYARQAFPDALRISLDDLRLMLCGRTFDPDIEPAIAVAADAIKEALAEYAASRGNDLVFDATNVTVERRAALVATARRHGFSPVAVYVASPLQIAQQRNRQRPLPVPPAILANFANHLVPPTRDEGFDDVIVVDASEASDNER